MGRARGPISTREQEWQTTVRNYFGYGVDSFAADIDIENCNFEIRRLCQCRGFFDISSFGDDDGPNSLSMSVIIILINASSSTKNTET
jgi:hypothetical protein